MLTKAEPTQALSMMSLSSLSSAARNFLRINNKSKTKNRWIRCNSVVFPITLRCFFSIFSEWYPTVSRDLFVSVFFELLRLWKNAVWVVSWSLSSLSAVPALAQQQDKDDPSSAQVKMIDNKIESIPTIESKLSNAICDRLLTLYNWKYGAPKIMWTTSVPTDNPKSKVLPSITLKF